MSELLDGYTETECKTCIFKDGEKNTCRRRLSKVRHEFGEDLLQNLQ